MRNLARFLPALVVLSAVNASAQGLHIDKKNGFQVQPPKEWSEIPLKVEEKWIVAKWLSNKKYEALKEQMVPSHNPLMRVILFEKKGEGAGAEVGSGGGEEKPEEVKPGDVIGLDAPYLDYKDYLKRNFSEGGFYISAEQETKIGGTPVTMIEVKVEKLSYTGKKRIMAWVFKAEFGDLAIEADSLEEHFDKLKPIILNAFKTFRVIKRDPNAKADPDEEVDTGAKIRVGDGKEETPEEMKKRRIASQEKVFKKAIESLPPEWNTKRTPHFLILNHGNPKFMEKVIAHAEQTRVWLDQNFGDVGKGYVQHMIIRICKNRDEENAFRKSSGDSYSFENREAVLSGGNDGFSETEFDYLGRSILQMYFHDKNADLYTALPSWLASGLSQYIGTAKVKGSKLEFAPDTYENEAMREGRRLGKLALVRDMFEKTSKDLWMGEDRKYLDAECVSIIRFVYGPGARQKKFGTLVKDYIANLLELVEENEKAARAEIGKGRAEPLTEEEEEEEFKKRKKQDWSAKEKEFLEKVSKKTFEAWTEADWNSFQAQWEKFSK